MTIDFRSRAVGLLLVPALLAVALAWVAVGDPSFTTLVVMNALVTYPAFFVLVFGYEALTRWLGKVVVVWQECLVVFVLAALVQVCVSFLSFGSYQEYQWLDIVITRAGHLTNDGIRFLSLQAIQVGIKYALAVALFSKFSRAKPNASDAHEA